MKRSAVAFDQRKKCWWRDWRRSEMRSDCIGNSLHDSSVMCQSVTLSGGDVHLVTSFRDRPSCFSISYLTPLSLLCSECSVPFSEMCFPFPFQVLRFDTQRRRKRESERSSHSTIDSLPRFLFLSFPFSPFRLRLLWNLFIQYDDAGECMWPSRQRQHQHRKLASRLTIKGRFKTTWLECICKWFCWFKFGFFFRHRRRLLTKKVA